jgi:C4-type Zn-finger protein
MALGKCPQCGEAPARLKYEEVLVDVPGRGDLRAYTLRCSECDTIITAALHPKVLGVMDRATTG